MAPPRNMNNATRWAILFSIAAGLLISSFSLILDEREHKVEAVIKWHTTPSGVSYYKECVEGKVFLVTRSTHSYKQLAGPVGECK